MWFQGKAWEVLPGLSGNTATVAFLKPWYPTCSPGACSTAIHEVSARGRLSAPTPDLLIQNLDPRKIPSQCVWTVKYEKRCVKTNSLTTIVISGVILKVFWVKRFFQWMESLMRQKLKPAYFICKGDPTPFLLDTWFTHTFSFNQFTHTLSLNQFFFLIKPFRASLVG